MKKKWSYFPPEWIALLTWKNSIILGSAGSEHRATLEAPFWPLPDVSIGQQAERLHWFSRWHCKTPTTLPGIQNYFFGVESLSERMPALPKQNKILKKHMMPGTQEGFDNVTKCLSSIIIHTLCYYLCYHASLHNLNELFLYSFFSVPCSFESWPKEILYHRSKCPQIKMMYSFSHLFIINGFSFIGRAMNFILKSPISQHDYFSFGLLGPACPQDLDVCQSQTTLYFSISF